MFKAKIFVEKHIQIKHLENIKEVEANATDDQFYRNYLTHGQRILPSSQFVFVDDEVKEKSPDRSPHRESSPRRRSQPSVRPSRPLRGSFRRYSQEGEPELKVDPRSLKTYNDLEDGTPNRHSFNQDDEQALASFVSVLSKV